MKLDYILELMKTAQSRLGNGQMDYVEAIDEAIDELKKVIIENDKMNDMKGSSLGKEEPQDEIVHINPLVFQNAYETEHWGKCYIAALNCGYAKPPQQIADMAICELRKRLEKIDE